MRRKDREVSDRAEILRIVDSCGVLSLALNGADGWPYAVELNFGWEERDGKVVLYLHGAKEGMKIDLIRGDGRCAFAMSADHRYVPDPTGRGATYLYSSACGRGLASIAEGDERARGLNRIMQHYEPGSDPAFGEETFRHTAVLKIEVEELTGKRNAGR